MLQYITLHYLLIYIAYNTQHNLTICYITYLLYVIIVWALQIETVTPCVNL